MSKCGAVDKFVLGRRELWASCGLSRGHTCDHGDPKYPHHSWKETFYPFEFEYGRPIKTKTVKKIKLCQKCNKQVRTDGAVDACVCKEIGATKKQAILFADERAKTAQDAAARDLADDIAWIETKWADREIHQERLAIQEFA